MAKTKQKDLFDTFIQSVNWKWGKFTFLPIFLGTLMALTDVVMMGSAKMIHEGTLSAAIGVPFTVLIYCAEPLLFIKSMNYEGMVIMNLTWDLLSDVLVTLQGVLIFGETIKGIRWIGVLFALVSLTIFAYTDTE
jgi:multidrug transporter EmrE-like cation transporter